MLLPLLILAVGAVAAGFAFHGYFIEPEAGEHFWKGAIAFNEHLMHAMHEVPVWVKLSATFAMLSGLLMGWLAYVKAPAFPAKFAAQFNVLYTFLLNKWYFDELYNLLFVKPAFAIGRFFWHRGDEQTIDRLAACQTLLNDHEASECPQAVYRHDQRQEGSQGNDLFSCNYC